MKTLMLKLIHFATAATVNATTTANTDASSDTIATTVHSNRQAKTYPRYPFVSGALFYDKRGCSFQIFRVNTIIDYFYKHSMYDGNYSG